MAENLGQIGQILDKIVDGVKTAKALRDNGSKLAEVSHHIQCQAEDAEKLQIPDEPRLFKLKQALHKLPESVLNLEILTRHVSNESDEFEAFVRSIVSDGNISTHEFCDALNRFHKQAVGFNNVFEVFRGQMTKALKAAMKLNNKLTQKAEDVMKQANCTVIKGTVATLILVLATVGLFVVKVVIGGSVWAMGAGFTSFASAGAGAATALDRKQRQRKMKKILDDNGQLQRVALNLLAISNYAEIIKLDVEAIKGLETALECFRKFEYQENEMEKQQMVKWIADLQAKLQSLGQRGL